MKGKTIIITGANSGIGKETAKALASQGASIIMGCRDATRAEAAKREICEETGSQAVEIIPLDLASLNSVRAFAQAFKQKYDKLDVLINNAGLLPFTKQMTEDGYEMQFGVNHLGHFLLTDLLLPELKAAGNARVVILSSMMHHLGKISFDSFKGEQRYGPMKAYGQSKLANALFARELSKRYAADGITAYSLHPGAVGTSIAGKSLLRRTLYKLLGAFLSEKRGARTSVYLATEPGIENLSGNYFDEFCKVKPGSALSRDEALAKKLWEVSDELLSTPIKNTSNETVAVS